MQLYGLILAGGRATRMHGNDKGLVAFNGRPLIDYGCQSLIPHVEQLMISCNRNINVYADLGAQYAAQIITDGEPGFHGPLMGIKSALEFLADKPEGILLVLPCDTPLIGDDEIQALIRSASTHSNKISVACVNGKRQPLHLACPTSQLEPLNAYLNSGEKRVGLWQKQQQAIEVELNNAANFANINSMNELSVSE